MTKFKLLNLIRKYGETILEFKNGDKPICCTVDFRETYIRKKRRSFVANYKENVLVFSWTDNSYKLIEPQHITKVTPLATILQNVRD